MAKNNDKVGSSRAAAGNVVGGKDFGAREDDRVERNYTSENTKRSDPGGGVARSGEGDRVSGVGGNESGRGSSSGGDVDAGEDALVGIGDRNLHPPHNQPQPSITASQRPVLPAGAAMNTRDPARTGDLDNESSTSAADVTNETVDSPPGFEGDVTSDEATGGASSQGTK